MRSDFELYLDPVKLGLIVYLFPLDPQRLKDTPKDTPIMTYCTVSH